LFLISLFSLFNSSETCIILESRSLCLDCFQERRVAGLNTTRRRWSSRRAIWYFCELFSHYMFAHPLDSNRVP
jgi:hypothetical protein